MKRLRRILRRLLIFIAVLVALGFVGFLILDKPLPKGRTGPEAEALADKMLAAVNIRAWDSLAFITWISPRSGARYLWDRRRDYVEINLDGHVTLINPRHGTGIATDDKGQKLPPEDAAETIQDNTHKFWNDAFWLVAFTKIRDEGTSRSLVELEDGSKALAVHYDKGGTTPGDTYLWHLDANGRPTRWQMWTHILPWGGVTFTWDDWITLPGGALVSTAHSASLATIRQEGVEGGHTLADMGRDRDPFAPLEAISPRD